MYRWLRPLLFQLDAETAHGLTLYGLDVAWRSELMRFVATPPADLPSRRPIMRYPFGKFDCASMFQPTTES